ncbi:MAG: LD-carboxypeptidase [Pseudomonadales bacterium]|nr:LD-carboxypeptidase [Pseudomonadales bacterium]
MLRRSFLAKSVNVTGLGLSMTALSAPALTTAPMPTLKHSGPAAIPAKVAPRLRPGMNIGLIAPASNAFEDDDLYFAMDIVRSLGFQVTPAPNLFKRHGYLAGTDQERASDFNRMFEDPAIDAVFCARGGYGASRILPLINYAAIAQSPKVLLGYSDITALHLAINAATGLISFHGPIATQQFSDYTYHSFKRLLLDAEPKPVIAQPPAFQAKPGRAERRNRLATLSPGKTQGRLIGGNLTLLTHLLGTPYAPDFTDAILFLEDVNEAPYRVDRMLTALWLAGVFEQIKGLAFGKFTKAATSGPSLSIGQVLRERTAGLGIPVVSGLMIGHIEDQATLPVGALAELDADSQTLRVIGNYLS